MRLRIRRPGRARDDEQPEGQRPEECLKPEDRVLPPFEVVAEPTERGDGRERDRPEQRVESKTVCTARIRNSGDEDQQGGKRSTSHGPSFAL